MEQVGSFEALGEGGEVLTVYIYRHAPTGRGGDNRRATGLEALFLEDSTPVKRIGQRQYQLPGEPGFLTSCDPAAV